MALRLSLTVTATLSVLELGVEIFLRQSPKYFSDCE